MPTYRSIFYNLKKIELYQEEKGHGHATLIKNSESTNQHPFRLIATILSNESNVAFDIIPVKNGNNMKRNLVQDNAHGIFKRDVSQQFFNDDSLSKYYNSLFIYLKCAIIV
jgi:hypothetical protein